MNLKSHIAHICEKSNKCKKAKESPQKSNDKLMNVISVAKQDIKTTPSEQLNALEESKSSALSKILSSS